MGAHWDWLGYASVDALAAEARGGIAGQVRLMARFIDKSGLARALRAHDWKAFARGYNGPAFHRNAYDSRLAAAYRRHAKALSGTTPHGLAPGARGEAVGKLQADLATIGFALTVDGIFGPETERMVRAFQARNRLRQTGIVCDATRAAIASQAARRRGTERRTPSGILGRALEMPGLRRLFRQGR
jgi:hypothetical protein